MISRQSSDIELIFALETAGPILPTELIDVCLERQDSLTTPFLHILAASREDRWELMSDPRWFRGGHAGKFLIAYQEESALPVFEQIYTSEDERDLDMVEWFGTECTTYGKTAVSPFIRVLKTDTNGAYHFGRAIAATTLKIIAIQHPETRDNVVEALRSELPGSPADLSANLRVDEMWTNIILELADLQDGGSRNLIEAMYEADLVDPQLLPLVDYKASFEPDAPLPPEAGDIFNIYTFYDQLLQQENQQLKMSGRRDLLRKQGYIPPEPDPQPYANRFSQWFNARLLKGTPGE